VCCKILAAKTPSVLVRHIVPVSKLMSRDVTESDVRVTFSKFETLHHDDDDDRWVHHDIF
jgi:hypothetical protein